MSLCLRWSPILSNPVRPPMPTPISPFNYVHFSNLILCLNSSWVCSLLHFRNIKPSMAFRGLIFPHQCLNFCRAFKTHFANFARITPATFMWVNQPLWNTLHSRTLLFTDFCFSYAKILQSNLYMYYTSSNFVVFMVWEVRFQCYPMTKLFPLNKNQVCCLSSIAFCIFNNIDIWSRDFYFWFRFRG